MVSVACIWPYVILRHPSIDKTPSSYPEFEKPIIQLFGAIVAFIGHTCIDVTPNLFEEKETVSSFS
jgi:hypothetical protein